MRVRFAAFVLGLLLAGCAVSTPSPALTLSPAPAVTASRTPALTPYRSATPRPVATPTPALGSPTPIPSPTPTPRTYVVRAGDDLFGIALRHGIPLEALMTANPTVDPNFLSIGIALQVPYVPSTPTPGAVTPTALPLTSLPPDCYRYGPTALRCFLPVRNDTGQAVEGVLGEVLVAAQAAGGEVLRADAFPPLDRILPGQTAPLLAEFASVPPGPISVDGRLTSAIPAAAEDTRYVAVTVEDLVTEIDEAGRLARVSGVLRVDPGAPAAQRARVLGVAYTGQGLIGGVRIWEAPGPLAPGSATPFAFTVYSMGFGPARVEIFAEARP